MSIINVHAEESIVIARGDYQNIKLNEVLGYGSYLSIMFECEIK